MEEKQFDILINEIKDLKKNDEQIFNEIKDLKNQVNVLDKKIDDTKLDLTKEIFKLGNDLTRKINDFKQIYSRENTMITEHFEVLYQESKNDREELHQNVNDLSGAHKLNRKDIDILMAKFQIKI